jgi:hypothetical protein
MSIAEVERGLAPAFNHDPASVGEAAAAKGCGHLCLAHASMWGLAKICGA